MRPLPFARGRRKSHGTGGCPCARKVDEIGAVSQARFHDDRLNRRQGKSVLGQILTARGDLGGGADRSGSNRVDPDGNPAPQAAPKTIRTPRPLAGGRVPIACVRFPSADVRSTGSRCSIKSSIRAITNSLRNKGISGWLLAPGWARIVRRALDDLRLKYTPPRPLFSVHPPASGPRVGAIERMHSALRVLLGIAPQRARAVRSPSASL